MEKSKQVKAYTLDEIKDEFIGKTGSAKRDKYELDLKIELLGDLIKKARKEKNLTQEQLGKLVGVQKSQISKIEKSTKNMTIGTVLRVFEALKAKVSLHVQLDPGHRSAA